MPDPILDAKPLDPAIYERIGRVASEWAYIEMLLAEMLAHFCSADSGSMYVITQNVSAATITDWLRTLLDIKPALAGSRDIVRKLLADIDTARKERNDIVHGVWTAHDDPAFGWLRTTRWDRKEVSQVALWSLGDIDDAIAHQHSLQLGLANLGIKLGFLRLET